MSLKHLVLKNLKTLTLVTFMLFIGSLVVQLYFTNKLAVQGKEMVALTIEKEDLLKQISALELEKSKYTSLAFIETQARAQGFVNDYAYISVISPVKVTASIPSF